jgi:hypothetical protein
MNRALPTKYESVPKLVLKIGRYTHLLDTIDTLAHSFFVQRDRIVLTPLFQRRFGQEDGKKAIVFDDWMVPAYRCLLVASPFQAQQ